MVVRRGIDLGHFDPLGRDARDHPSPAELDDREPGMVAVRPRAHVRARVLPGAPGDVERLDVAQPDQVEDARAVVVRDGTQVVDHLDRVGVVHLQELRGLVVLEVRVPHALHLGGGIEPFPHVADEHHQQSHGDRGQQAGRPRGRPAKVRQRGGRREDAESDEVGVVAVDPERGREDEVAMGGDQGGQ
jgi:hypothetical protein